jgi:hypothetical protein
MSQMMMPVSKWRRGWSITGGADRTGGCSGRKMKPVKLPQTMWITTMGASLNQVISATILNIASIRVMKRVRRKSALSNYRKRGSISGMNNAMARRS